MRAFGHSNRRPDWPTDRDRATKTVARLADRPRPCDQGRGPTGRPTAAVRPRPWPDWPTDRIRVTARSPVTRWVSRSSVLVPRRACVRQYPRGGAGSRADGKSASVPRRAALVYLVPAALGCRRCGRHPLAGRESVRVSTPWRVGAYLVWWPRFLFCPPRETLRRADCARPRRRLGPGSSATGLTDGRPRTAGRGRGWGPYPGGARLALPGLRATAIVAARPCPTKAHSSGCWAT